MSWDWELLVKSILLIPLLQDPREDFVILNASRVFVHFQLDVIERPIGARRPTATTARSCIHDETDARRLLR